MDFCEKICNFSMTNWNDGINNAYIFKQDDKFWYYFIKVLGMDISMARGYIMALMVFIQNIHVFNCRSEKQSAFSIPLKSNKLILVAFATSILLQILVMEVPILSQFLQTVSIPVSHLTGLFALALIILLVVEIYKKLRFHHE